MPHRPVTILLFLEGIPIALWLFYCLSSSSMSSGCGFAIDLEPNWVILKPKYPTQANFARDALSRDV
jgi:hypothetical protein